MGKAKKRSIALGKHNQIENLSREGAIDYVVKNLSQQENVEEIITLFGLTAEELLEAGAPYETVKVLEKIL